MNGRFTNETLSMMKSALGNKFADNNFLNKASVTTASGLTYYDLRAPALLLTPLNLTPLIDRTPRKNKGGGAGVACHWKSILAVTGSGFDNEAWVPEGQRSGTLSYSATDVLAAYQTMGEEGSLTFEAEAAAEGFEDENANLTFIELMKFRRKEEIAVLGGNSSVKLGTPTTPTASAAGTGGTIATATYYVSVVLLTQEGYSNFKSGGSTSIIEQKTVNGADGDTYSINGGSSAASVAVSQAITSGQILTVNATYKTGAVAYAWYVGLIGAQTFQKVTTTSTTTFAALTTTGQSITAITGDRSYNDGTGSGAKPVSAFDGFMYTAFKAGSNAYVQALGTTLTASGSGTVVEIDTALQTMWDTYRISPTIIWVSSQELTTIRNKCMQNATTPLLRINQDASGKPYELRAGGTITYYYNPYGLNGGQEIPVMLHPDVAPGTILLYAEQLPAYYANNHTPVVAEVLCRRDYYRIDWPLTTRKREYGIYAEEVLAVYAPFAMGIITNIIAG